MMLKRYVRVNILALFLILVEKLWVSYHQMLLVASVCNLYHVEVLFIVSCIFILRVEFCQMLSLHLLIWLTRFFLFSLLMWWTTLIDFWIWNQACILHTWEKSHFGQGIIFYTQNWLAYILLKLFACIFMRDTGL